jgi:hypothetical protein
MLDDALNKLVLNMMRWAPIVFLIMGYWAMGNKQIFYNEVYPMQYENAPIVTGHFGLPNDGPDLPLFIAACVLILCIIFSIFVKKLLIKVKLIDETIPEVDEKLGNYW